jgi:hypothetical protein
MGIACSTIGEKRNGHSLLQRTSAVKSQLGRTRRRCVDNIKTDLGEIEWGCMDWIDLTQNGNQ